jgi:hypothetical protein
VKTLLIWAVRSRPGRLPTSLRFPCNPFPGRHRTRVPRRLSAPQLKAILGACYAEIDAGREDLEKDPCTDAVKSRKPRRSHIADAIVLFFLAIGIQTAANPDALRLIRRNCLAPYPLDENRLVIDWAKPRAGGEVRRAQHRSFDRRRPYAAPNLIDRVAAMTEPLVAEARPSERNHLFLVRGNRPVGVGTIRQETLRLGIQRFIARANARIAIWNNAHPDKPRALLPNFAPVLFRSSVATEHYGATEFLVSRLYDACFIVIAYLIGARVSEILGLKAGCIVEHPSAEGTETFTYLSGRIYKTADSPAGQAHRWVAPSPVVRAVTVLERLSESVRRFTGRNELWLVPVAGGNGSFHTRRSVNLTDHLNGPFAAFIGLPLHEGRPWHLSPHRPLHAL